MIEFRQPAINSVLTYRACCSSYYACKFLGQLCGLGIGTRHRQRDHIPQGHNGAGAVDNIGNGHAGKRSFDCRKGVIQFAVQRAEVRMRFESQGQARIR